MGNLIIKPNTGGTLNLQDEGGTDAITISTTGNTTLAGTTNNIGTVTTGTWNGSIIGTAYGGNLVKTGSQTWNGSETSKYINACFSATYKSYLMNGAFWNPESGNPSVRLQYTTGTDTAHSGSYEYGFYGGNMDGTVGNSASSGSAYAVLDGSFSSGAGKTISFSFVVKGTHDADMEPSMMGTILSESSFWSGGIFNTAEATTMVGLYLSLESSKNIEGWINVYGIQE